MGIFVCSSRTRGEERRCGKTRWRRDKMLGKRVGRNGAGMEGEEFRGRKDRVRGAETENER